MKTLLFLSCVFVLHLGSSYCWTPFRQPPSSDSFGSFIATVRFTIRNLTSNWAIPGPTRPGMGARTTTVRPRPRPTTTTRRRTTAKTTTTTPTPTPTTTTTTTLPPPLPFVNTIEEIKESQFECNSLSCESDNVQVLEKCDDFCLHEVMGKPDIDSQSQGVSTSTSTESSAPASTGIEHSCHEYASKCTCHYDLAPVCGTNGNTYSNLCELECAVKCTPGLKFARNGACDKRRKQNRA